MTTISYDMSISLDGFVTSAGKAAASPLGTHGEQLHTWALPGSSDTRTQELMAERGARLGAMIIGRRTYDESLPFWGPNGPTGHHRLPVFVVTHRVDPGPAADSVYTFVDTVEAAVQRARETAGDKAITVMGAEVGTQLLHAGLIDEMWIHIAPVLFGDGVPLHRLTGASPTNLELVQAVSSPLAVHLLYRVQG